MSRALGIAALVGAIALTQPVSAQESSGDFTFRRVKPPNANSPRITVQIAPGAPTVHPAPENPIPASPRTPPVVAGDTSNAFDWYWQAVSPNMAADSPGRFATAVAALSAAPVEDQVRQPRLQSLKDIASSHGVDILKSTIGTKVSPALVLAVISVESAGRKDAESGAGAQGLMQLIPATAERFGVSDSFDPAENIRGGVAYLDWLMSEFDGDAVMALAGYNAGENAVKKHGGVPPFAETRGYVPKVLAAWEVAKGLCSTPPELPSDGCVFATGGPTGG